MITRAIKNDEEIIELSTEPITIGTLVKYSTYKMR